MVSGELAGEGLQTGFSRHGLPPQRASLDTVYPLREHLNSVQRRVSGGYCEGLFPDTVCWTRLRNTWSSLTVHITQLFLCNLITWPPTEEGNAPTSKIGRNTQKYTKKYQRSYFLDVFLPYFEGRCVFLSCRGPSLSKNYFQNEF